MHHKPTNKKDGSGLIIKPERKPMKRNLAGGARAKKQGYYSKSSWQRVRKLGSGAFGTVHLAVSKDPSIAPTGSKGLVAVKSAEVSRLKTLEHEAELLNKFHDCPHILRCYSAKESVENGERLYNLFLEYASGGSLRDLIKKSKNSNARGGLPEDQIKKITRGLLAGLSHVHGMGYVHRDIKPDNILLDGEGNVKIADFGLATKYGVEQSADEEGSDDEESGEVTGTLPYMAPEIITEDVYEPGVDIWALGCTVIEMITGEKVWEGFEESDVTWEIASGSSPEIPKWLSWEAADFLRRCLEKDPKQRWTADMLLSHLYLEETEEEELVSRSADMGGLLGGSDQPLIMKSLRGLWNVRCC